LVQETEEATRRDFADHKEFMLLKLVVLGKKPQSAWKLQSEGTNK
jgi:hypothetical protein